MDFFNRLAELFEQLGRWSKKTGVVWGIIADRYKRLEAEDRAACK